MLDRGIKEQLWTFGALTLGGPLSRTAAAAPPQIDTTWDQDVREAVLGVLAALVDGPEVEELSIPSSITAHTLSTILCTVEQDEPAVRVVALDLLKSFVERYLEKVDRMPNCLPGIVSTLCKVMLASRGNSQIVIPALAALGSSIQATINDDRSLHMGILDEEDRDEEQVIASQSLEALFSSRAGAGIFQLAGEDSAESRRKTAGTNSSLFGSKSSSTSEVPKGASSEAGASKAWLRATASQLHRAILSLMPVLRSHENATVRLAFSDFCCLLLETCWRSLLHTTRMLLLEELLILSLDDWDAVAQRTSSHLDSLMSTHSSIPADMQAIAKETLRSLPHSIFSHGQANELALQRRLRLVEVAFRRLRKVQTASLQPERWSRSLLKALELVPLSSSQSSASDLNAATPWLQANQSVLFLENESDNQQSNGTPRLPPFPAPKFVNIAPGTSVARLEKALQAVSQATVAAGSPDLLEHFLGLADAPEEDGSVAPSSASALWLVQQIMEGYATASGTISEGNVSRIGRDVVTSSLAWLEFEESQAVATPAAVPKPDILDSRDDHEDAMQGIEIISGAKQITHLLGDDFNAAPVARNGSSSPKRGSHYPYAKAFALQLLSTSADLLRIQFRPYFLYSLYPLLRSLTPSTSFNHPFVQAYAYCASQHIANYTHYDSPASMLLQNVDYVLNSVSARLHGSASLGSGSLDPLAPSVLVCVIDLTGEAILPYLGDAVDEIFDSLDRWHAYDLLVSELLRVLDKLVSVCKVDPSTYSNSLEESLASRFRLVMSLKPDRQKDLDEFETWFKSRHESKKRHAEERESTVREDTMPDVNPRIPFKELDPSGSESEGPEEGMQGGDGEEREKATTTTDSDTPPPTRSQALVLSIMRKSLYFITHASPFLRARVLSLITSSVPVLQDRSSDLLPEIHRFWPFIVARLDDGFERSPAYVLLECMRLIHALMKYKGDFMNTRVIQDVWPRIRKAIDYLVHTKQHERLEQYTTEHRVVSMCIETMSVAVSTVPGLKNEDVWEIVVLFRPFLALRQDETVREAALELYRAVASIEPDIVWLVVQGTMGEVEGLAHLRMKERLDEAGVCAILQVAT